jgi:hypothetical protein
MADVIWPPLTLVTILMIGVTVLVMIALIVLNWRLPNNNKQEQK